MMRFLVWPKIELGCFLPTACAVFGRHSATTAGHNRMPSKYAWSRRGIWDWTSNDAPVV